MVKQKHMIKLKKNGIIILHRHKSEKDIFPEGFKVVEEKWQKYWSDNKTFLTKIDKNKEKFVFASRSSRKENFILKKGDRFYKKTSSLEPSTYIFTIESTGVIKLKNIFPLALETPAVILARV